MFVLRAGTMAFVRSVTIMGELDASFLCLAGQKDNRRQRGVVIDV